MVSGKSLEEYRREVEAHIEYARNPIFGKDIPNPEGQLYLAYTDWPNKDWDTYATGYRTAGDALVSYLATGTHEQDWLVYPIVFLYRHYLEVRFKDLIYIGSRLARKPLPTPIHHDLMRLWGDARKYIEMNWPEQDPEQLNTISERVKELATIDPSSDAFRYPVDTGGRPNLKGLSYTNLRHMKKIVTGLSYILDGSSIGMGEALQADLEMRAEFEADMRTYEGEY